MDMNHQACGVSCHGAASVIGPHADAHTSAHFFMYQYKVVLCPKRYSHDWGACPYAHEKEKARRRDPQTFLYSSCICPNASKGECPNGLQCPYAHTLFEYWLHPARFRTQMCRSGTDCRRALCFFAHTAEELRSPGKAGPANELPPLPAAAAPAPLMGMQLQQQQQQLRGLVGTLPFSAAADMPWTAPAEDRSSSSFTSSCSVVTAGGSSFMPMLSNAAPVVSSTDALCMQLPGVGISSSSPLLMSSGNDILVPVQQQMMMMMPANQAYLLQLQQQQQQLQQQAKLQVLQMELQQQQNNVRAALRGMEQQQGSRTPQALAAAAAGSSSFEGYPISAFSGAPGSFAAAAAVAGQPGSGTPGALPPQDVSADFVCLQNGLASSMANMSIGGGINFGSGPCIVGIDNSGSHALGASETLLAAAGQQQQQQQRPSGLVESWM